MNAAAETVIAMLAGLAAGSFGLGVAPQHRQVQLAPVTGRAPLRLLAHLARRRLWLAGIALAAAAYGLQALALAFGPLALVAAAAVTAAALTRGRARAALLAAAGGAVFGLTAALTLSLTRLVHREGYAPVPRHWQAWALLALGTAGLLLSASAFQAGALAASLPVIDSVEPVSAVLIGILIFGEHLATSPAGLALQFAGAAAIAGIILLGRSPLAAPTRSHATGQQPPPANQLATAAAARGDPATGRLPEHAA